MSAFIKKAVTYSYRSRRDLHEYVFFLFKIYRGLKESDQK